MSIFSSIGSALSSAYNSVKSGISSAVNYVTGNSNTATASNAWMIAPPASSSNRQNPIASGNTVITSGGRLAYIPTASQYTQNFMSSNPQYSYTVNGTQTTPSLPVTISAGQQKSSGGSSGQSQVATSFAPVQQPRTITSSMLGGGSGSSLTASGSGVSSAPQSISLPSAPMSTNPGQVNTSGLAGALSGYKKYNATTGQYEDVADPTQVPTETDTQTANRIKSLRDSILGVKPDVYSDPEVVVARQKRQQLQEALLAPTNELNAIVAKQNQDLLQLRKTGSQEGVTEAVYGGQSNAINYNASIRALPLQASIAGIQGNLKLAQDYLSELTQVKTEQINNQYEYNKSLFTAIEGALEKKDQKTYDALKTQNERQYQEQKDLIKTQDTLLQSAVSQGAPQSVINAIANSTTNQQAIMAAGQYAGDIMERQTKQVQYDNAVLQGQKLANEVAAGKPVTGEYAPIINAVSSLVGATKAPAVKQAVSTSIANGDFSTAYANIANAVEDSLTGSNKTKFADARTDIGVMEGMRNAIKEYTDAGGNLGYLKGTADTIAKKFGQLTTDPKFAALGVQLQREFQSYRLAMTGAAFSPAESKEYAAVNPRTNASLDLNLATIDGALAQLTNRVTSTVNQRIPDAQKIYNLVTGKQNTPTNVDYTKTLDSIFK